MKNAIILIFTAIALATTSVYANHHGEAPKGSLFLNTFSSSLDGANEKIISLAEAFGEDQLDWRPAEGIRSVKESILHVAGANYFLAGKLGLKKPAGVNMKDVKTKSELISALKASMDHVTKAVAELSEAELAEKIDFFGNEMPRMGAVLQVAAHANEHLGQLIAYARSTGVVPPWSK